MSFSTWWLYFLACWVIALSPGSGAVLCMSHGLSYGVRQTSFTIAGLQTALMMVLFVAGLGVGSILLASETAFMAVKLVGAAYLFYLGWSQWRAKVSLPTSEKSDSCPKSTRAPILAVDACTHAAHNTTATQTLANSGLHAASNPTLSAHKKFLIGFLTNATNPKGIVFMVAVLPQFINQAQPLMPQLCLMALTMFMVDTLVMHGYAFAASRLRGLFQNAAALKMQNRIFGGVLMAAGAALLAFKRTTTT